jgi:hypothetical protein
VNVVKAVLKTLIKQRYAMYDLKYVKRQTILKAAIGIALLLAAGGIVAYKILPSNSNYFTLSNSFISYTRAFSNIAVPFAFGQPASENTSNKGIAIQAEQNLGVYVESLDELNLVAADKEAIIIFIPKAENAAIDDKTKAAIFNFQKGQKNGSTTIGTYTLWYDSADYLRIAQQVPLPAIIVARNDKGTITMPGSNISEYGLIQAYRRAGKKGYWEYYTAGCC